MSDGFFVPSGFFISAGFLAGAGGCCLSFAGLTASFFAGCFAGAFCAEPALSCFAGSGFGAEASSFRAMVTFPAR